MEDIETVGQLREELRKARDDHNMALGAITSLQRQMEVQESELRRIRSEREVLQKQLTEREFQLQDAYDKFWAATEGQMPEKMTVITEEEYQRLLQLIADQESQLDEQSKLISELQKTISQLQAEAVTNRLHLLEQKQTQREIQRQAEELEQKELQARVALECMSTKSERFRNRIIQATFSTEGSHDPQTELTDDEVLEAVQKIICERTEFQHKLHPRNRGSRMSLLSSSDSRLPSPATARKRSSSKLA
ncbi:coiled-coil domain-containing protein 27 isoform X1 [Malurus melanocephalus]|uniref:coiled-coil domain-containing protein 27 isoform X1 n=1 Tax=Malurus melanocephalus TaxID=175006 RepID=UPI002549BDEA|nr:coiled-coil domain-containing protein 27 isoform X1 [Malurus melanocephalus]